MVNKNRSLSIILPIYNSAQFLPSALESLEISSHLDYQIILVNDGSTDESFKICQAFIEKNPKTILIHQENRGYGAACNAGLNQATSDYVAIFEPDDLVSSAFYPQLLTAAQKTDADMIRCNGFYTFDYTVKQLASAHYGLYADTVFPKNQIKSLWKNHPCIWNAIYKRKILTENNVRFAEGPGASFQDAQFLVSLYYSIKTIFIIDRAGYYYRHHPDQSINTADNKVDAIILNWEEQLSWLKTKKNINLDYFLFNTFNQFNALCENRINKKENRFRLYHGIKKIAKKTGLSHLSYPETSFELRFSFFFLNSFSIIEYTFLLKRFFKKIFSGRKISHFFKHKSAKKSIENNLLYEKSISMLSEKNQHLATIDHLWNNQLYKAELLAIRLNDYWALNALLPETRIVSHTQKDINALLPRADFFLLWGQFRDKWAFKFLEQAKISGRPILFMEEGLLRSVTPTPDTRWPSDFKVVLSFIADAKGSYFDVTRPSMLEDMLNSDRELTSDEISRAQKLITTIVASRLSKINYQPETLPDLGDMHRDKVLIVDQSCNDWSIAKGASSAETFQHMLESALAENPDADIIIKTHPDMLSRFRRGDSTSLGHYNYNQISDRVIFLTDPVNPYTLMEPCKKIYVCTSQFGFEALMMGKPTVIFGAPFYAGWGIGDLRNQSHYLKRRSRKRTVAEIFFFMYLEYTRYVHPQTMRPCQLEEFLPALIRMRAIFRENFS